MVVLLLAGSCQRADAVGSASVAASASASASEGRSNAEASRAAAVDVAPTASDPRTPSTDDRDGVQVLLGGDVSFARSVGQRILSDPQFDPFAEVAPWFKEAELTVLNLEAVLSDQGGVTEHPLNHLVFAGPPAAAQWLVHAGVDAVSSANNHSWDYSKKGLVESLGHLQRAGIASLGASATRERQYEPVVVVRGGLRIGLLAFTQVWNDGKLREHVAQPYVADADYEPMKRALRKVRSRSDVVLVSLHAGNEYVDLPRERTRRFAKALIDSGADVVFGHHPHVLQGVEWIGQAPILYSLGNLVFDSRHPSPAARHGALARLTLQRRGDAVHVEGLELCPVELTGGVPAPEAPGNLLTDLPRLSRSLGGLEALATDDGCVSVRERELPLPYAKRRGFLPDPKNPADDG